MGNDAYAKRQRRKKARGQGCMITLLVGGSLLAGVALIVESTVRWLV
jgi:hypothetical protein